MSNVFKSGYVAIVGRPNVGKSTLMNALLEFKVSITSPRPQTTRHRILGITSGPDHQMIFLDTPGIIEAKYQLHTLMVKHAQRAIGEADIITMLVEPKPEPDTRGTEILHELEALGKPIILGINKIDQVEKTTLLPVIQWYSEQFRINAIIPISALKQDGLTELRQALIGLLPEGPQLYPADQLTEHPERFFVSELIRERIFVEFDQEIPYSTAVVVDEFRERPGAKDLVRARIVVERESQKGIVVGKGGQKIKQIGQSARKEIEAFLTRPIYLELQVVVREKWRKKAIFLKEFGYE